MLCKIEGIDSGSMDVLYVPANSGLNWNIVRSGRQVRLGLFREGVERERDAQFGLFTGQKNSGQIVCFPDDHSFFYPMVTNWSRVIKAEQQYLQGLHESIFWTFFNAVRQKIEKFQFFRVYLGFLWDLKSPTAPKKSHHVNPRLSEVLK